MKRILAAIFMVILTGCQHRPAVAGATGKQPFLEEIRISPDGHGFVSEPSGRPFHPWGNNYGNKGRLIEDYWDAEWDTVAADFKEMKRMGANVVRVHLQIGKIMRNAHEPNRHAFDKLSDLVRLAESTGLYLDITGLACYRASDVPPWLDKLSESDRWAAQAKFWQAVAARCSGSPAIFCYDLINEPLIATDRQKPGAWYTGAFGGLNFLQFINLDPKGRSSDEIATQWLTQMKSAIRRADPRHFITAGLLPFPPGKTILDQFDYVSVHIYPESGKNAEALATLEKFDIGKPVVIEETFPLSCPKDQLRQFLLDSRAHACGWVGHYNGEPIPALDALRQSGQITPAQSAWLAWEELFVELGPQMTAAR